jgi:dihydrolipoamide dehydrogenase
LPKEVLLFGRVPWLIEIAQFLNRFGCKVILATQDKSLLSDESKTISSRLRKSLKDSGIDIRNDAEIIKLTKNKDGLEVGLRSKDRIEKVFVEKIITAERGAALKGLGLENVQLDEGGNFIKVNEKMETRISGVYAIGDITEKQFRHYSHLASEEGIIAAENSMGGKSVIDERTFTRIIYTQPEVACIGLTAKEAKAAGYDVYVGAAPLSMNPYGMILSENEGIIEIVADKKYGEILGIHLIGTNASEMACQAILAIRMEMTLEELAKTSFPHPTLSESLAEAARDALGVPIYLP